MCGPKSAWCGACARCARIAFRASEEAVAAGVERHDRLHPFVVSAAANLATFAAAYRHDVAEVERLQAWAEPYFADSWDGIGAVLGLCYRGLAYWLMLENQRAEQYYRQALRRARRSGGSHSYTARLSSSLLGELLYERGDLAEAGLLLDEGYRLGPEGGSVDFKIARYVTGARIKALGGDRLAAMDRLNEAARIARMLELPRLAALTENERIRSGLPPHPEFGVLPLASYEAPCADRRSRRAHRATRGGDGNPRPAGRPGSVERELACRWAQEWVDRFTTTNRLRARIQARRLLVACLAAAGRREEAKATLVVVLAECARAEMVRYIPDGGPQVVATLADLLADLRAGRWRAELAPVPANSWNAWPPPEWCTRFDGDGRATTEAEGAHVDHGGGSIRSRCDCRGPRRAPRDQSVGDEPESDRTANPDAGGQQRLAFEPSHRGRAGGGDGDGHGWVVARIGSAGTAGFRGATRLCRRRGPPTGTAPRGCGGSVASAGSSLISAAASSELGPRRHQSRILTRMCCCGR